jgi:hypothetical protein
MNIDDKLQTLRAIVAETESKDQQTWAIVRGMLGEIEEELRTLRAEAVVKHIEYFSEEEFAKRIGVSRETIQRLRLRLGDRIQPPPYIGGVVRWSTKHLLAANEIFGVVDTGKKKPGPKGQGSVISDSRFQNSERKRSAA